MRSQITALEGEDKCNKLKIQELENVERCSSSLLHKVKQLEEANEVLLDAKEKECNQYQEELSVQIEKHANMQMEISSLQFSKANYIKLEEDYMAKDVLIAKMSEETRLAIDELQMSLKMKDEEYRNLHNDLILKQDDFETLKNQFEEMKLNGDVGNADIMMLMENLKKDYCKLQKDYDNLKKQHDAEQKVLNDQLENEKIARLNERGTFESEKITWQTTKSQFETTIEGNSRLISELKKAIERLETDVESSRVTESKLAEQTSGTILQLRQENMSLQTRLDEVQHQVESLQSTGNATTLNSENSELLAEMNVMNQALKERGETISQQQAHCEELVKKIQVYEGQLAKSQENVQQLQDEMQSLRANLNLKYIYLREST